MTDAQVIAGCAMFFVMGLLVATLYWTKDGRK